MVGVSHTHTHTHTHTWREAGETASWMREVWGVKVKMPIPWRTLKREGERGREGGREREGEREGEGI